MKLKLTTPTPPETRDWLVFGEPHGPYYIYLCATCQTLRYFIGRRVLPSADLPALSIDAPIDLQAWAGFDLLAWVRCGDSWLIHLKSPHGDDACYSCGYRTFRVLINKLVLINKSVLIKN